MPHDFHCPAPHPLVSSENSLSPDRHGADLARAFGLDACEAPRVFGSRQATITIWLARAGEHA